MDQKIAGLLGAAAALTAANSAQAATLPAEGLQPAATYRDLLEPIPNALAVLKTEDTQEKAPANGQVRLAYHHHHHHRWWRRYWHHHHHHHRYYHHHHHHHY
jgi:hypothetical protein